MKKSKQEESIKQVVDCTPTWAGLLPMLLQVLMDGNTEGKQIVRKELQRMAEVADMLKELQDELKASQTDAGKLSIIKQVIGE